MHASPLKQEFESAGRGALVVPAPDLAVLLVRGEDRLTWLNGLITCDLSTRSPGDAVYGLAVAQKGKIITDLVVLLEETRLLLVVPLILVEEVRTAFDRYLIMEDAEVAPATSEFTFYRVHGPRSEDVLKVAQAAGASGGLIDRTGQGGALIAAPNAVAGAVETALRAAILEIPEVRFGTKVAEDALFVERGTPRFGVDFDQSMYPQEAGLEKVAVSFSKGCYLGQEVVCMLELRGHVKRKLAPLVFEDGEAGLPSQGSAIEDADGQVVGQITSASLSPDLQKVVALGMLKRAHTEVGHELRAGGRRVVVRKAPYERGA